FQLRLPSAWRYGLEYLPGYDPEKGLVRLTTKLEISTDGDGNPVGFLGRAHPLVRRALDRVRNLSFGGTAAKSQDPRASAVQADVPEPQLLYTFLGRVSSRAGRELERVLAVQVSPSGNTAVYESADRWSHLADLKKAIRPTDLWKKHFAGWAPGAADGAQQAAAGCFRPLAEGFARERKLTLQAEQEAQQQWLAKRAEEITGRADGQVQLGLLDQPASRSGDGSSSPAWWSITDPEKRLAAFGSDGGQLPAKRSEADGVLRIHEKRKKILDALLDLGQPQIVPLGVLMLMPEERDNAMNTDKTERGVSK
ncbi:MAG: hypothetical protein ABSG53_10565, partial [Thermoguttaceae bacterium]